MRIVFRADASVLIGTGHVMRCLTLADQLLGFGARVAFACRRCDGHLINLIEGRGFAVLTVTSDAEEARVDPAGDARSVVDLISAWGSCDWVVVDHYGLEQEWERGVRVVTNRVMVIDDLANRRHDCDVLLDQNFYLDAASRYLGLVPGRCKLLLGPGFALLREQFHEARRHLRPRSGEIDRILVFMGGSDSANVTGKVIRAILPLDGTIAVDVVVGSTNPHLEEVSALCNMRAGISLHVQVSDMASLMAGADLAIGAGGTTTWERCYLGLPTLTLAFAENQVPTTRDLAAVGATTYVGWAESCSVADLTRAVDLAVKSPMDMREMGLKALSIMEGVRANPRSVARTLAFE